MTEIVVRYDLFDLPTAQHKAGLAGLILQLRSLEARKELKAGEYLTDLTPTTATFRFTPDALVTIFDDLYAAKPVRVESKSKWQGTEPLEVIESEEEDPETKKKRKVKKFVYEVVQPQGRFLRDHYPAMPENKDWHKLWRDMLWAVPRGNPLSREPFNQIAAGKRPCKVGPEAWDDLQKVEKEREKGGFHTTDVAGSLWLGAQAVNAEAVPFQGRAEQTLLLHFWPLTALVFVPQQITVEGDSEFVGYALAIPEVADLEGFLDDYPRLLGSLTTDVRGFRPAEAVIDLPDEGALVFLEHLAGLTEQKTRKGGLKFSVGSVEFLHLVKIGNNIKLAGSGRVAPRDDLLEAYQDIVGNPVTKTPPTFRNPIFRRAMITALVKGRPWYEPFAQPLAVRPWPTFVRSAESPRNLSWFWQDAATQFERLAETARRNKDLRTHMGEAPVSDQPSDVDDRLPGLVHRLVQNYVNRRTEEKSGMTWESFQDKKVKDEKTGRERTDVPKAYSEAREKVASGVFLEMRSRREQEFVDHFTATFCSVRQFLPADEFQVVAKALLSKSDSVKTLTLLALSANS